VGDTDNYYTYYIFRMNHTCNVPIGKSNYAKTCEELGLSVRDTSWYITSNLGDRSINKEATHYFITGSLNGFETAELALESLRNYLVLTGTLHEPLLKFGDIEL
jgi:hypothetical protein